MRIITTATKDITIILTNGHDDVHDSDQERRGHQHHLAVLRQANSSSSWSKTPSSAWLLKACLTSCILRFFFYAISMFCLFYYRMLYVRS